MILLQNGLRQPHRLLNAYVEHITDFSITDASKFVKGEQEWLLPEISGYRLDFSNLKESQLPSFLINYYREETSDFADTGTTADLHSFIVNHLVGSTTATSLDDGNRAKCVEYGLALNKSKTKAVVVDEPLVLLATTQWMNKNHRTSYDFLKQNITSHDPHGGSNCFENYLAYSLDLIFSKKRRLDDVFEFHGKVPIWATWEAEIVALYRPCTQGSDKVEVAAVSFSDSKAPSVTLGANGREASGTKSWLDHADKMRPPFCFPHPRMGPDILFILRLSDGSLIWVALQAKHSMGKRLTNEVLSRAVRSVTPSKYFMGKVSVS